jgi:ATP-binding cassette subfamily B (MDR/TAP) protein 1
MGEEPTLHTSGSRPQTADEIKTAFSKELTPSEHVTLDMNENPKGIRAFLRWPKKTSKKILESQVENAKAADTLAPASFLSLFRLDHPAFDLTPWFTNTVTGIRLALK